MSEMNPGMRPAKEPTGRGCLKWLVGILLFIAANLMFYFFIGAKFMEKQPATLSLRQDIEYFAKEKGEKGLNVAVIRRVVQTRKEVEIIPGTGLMLTAEEIKDKSETELKDYVVAKLADYMYEQGSKSVVIYFAGQAEWDSVRERSGPFAVFLDKSFKKIHDDAYRNFIIFEIVTVLLLVGFILLTRKMGRFAGMGTIVLLVTGPKFLYLKLIKWWLEKAAPDNKEVMEFVRPFTLQPYQDIFQQLEKLLLSFLIGAGVLLLVAIVGKILSRNSEQQSY